MFVPEPLNELIDELYASPGVQAVVIGGSRTVGRERPDSDWDIGVYYRDNVDMSMLTTRGEVFPPGAWGRIMNGGSWLTVDDVRVDVYCAIWTRSITGLPKRPRVGSTSTASRATSQAFPLTP